MAGLATYIGYQAADAPDYTKLQEAFQAQQLKEQAQQQKQQLAADKSFYAATESLRDFTTGVSPTYTDMIQQGVIDMRNGLFFENTKSGKSPADLKRFNNNMAEGWQSVVTFGTNFEKNANSFVTRAQNINPKTNKPQASLLETQFLSKMYLQQGLTTDAQGNTNKIIFDPSGNVYMGTFDKDGNMTQSVPTQVNTLNNVGNFQQDNVSLTNFTQKFTAPIEKINTEIKNKTNGAVTTFSGLALEYNARRTPGGKTFQEVYNNAINSSYSAVMAQPNVAVAALTGETMAPDGNPWFFYVDGVASGEFALNGRDPENGIKMVSNKQTSVFEGELTDKQKDLLKTTLEGDVRSQMGYSKNVTYDRSFAKGMSEKEVLAADIRLAMQLRAGNEEEWSKVIDAYNLNGVTKTDDQIISYRVTPERIILKKATGDFDVLNVGEFTGQSNDAINNDLADLFLYIDPKGYNTRTKQTQGVKKGREALKGDPTFIAEIEAGEYDYTGTRGVVRKLTETERVGLFDKLGFDINPTANTTNIASGIGNFVDELQTVVNYDPLTGGPINPTGTRTGRTSPGGAGGSIIDNIKIYNPNKPSFSLTVAGDDVSNKNSFATAFERWPQKDAFLEDQVETYEQGDLSGKTYMEITVKGGPEGTATKTYKFRPIGKTQRGAPADEQIMNKNAETYQEMLNFVREPLRGGDVYYGSGFSSIYNENLFR